MTAKTQTAVAGTPEPEGKVTHRPGKCVITRRRFLLTSGLATATVMVTLNSGTPFAQEVPGVVATYPRKLIAQLSALKPDEPLDFDTLQPHGCFIGSAAVIILSQHDSARKAALNAMRFFEHFGHGIAPGKLSLESGKHRGLPHCLGGFETAI